MQSVHEPVQTDKAKNLPNKSNSLASLQAMAKITKTSPFIHRIHGLDAHRQRALRIFRSQN